MALPFGIGELFGGVQEALAALLQLAEEVFDDVHTTIPRIRDLIAEVEVEVEAWKNFRHEFDAQFKNRVINVESLGRKLRAILAGLSSSWEALRDVGRQLREPIAHIPNPLLRSRNPILRAIGNLLNALDIISQYVVKVSAILDDLEQILQSAKAVRITVENLDSIFLQQRNPRESVRLRDGGSIRIRVGSLH